MLTYPLTLSDTLLCLQKGEQPENPENQNNEHDDHHDEQPDEHHEDEEQDEEKMKNSDEVMKFYDYHNTYFWINYF